MFATTENHEVVGIIFDMDGVLASVGQSYNLSIAKTAERYGAVISQADIVEAKKKGDANNDWILSQRLIRQHTNTEPSLEDVTSIFEEIYQGTDDVPGLCKTEMLIPCKGLLEELFFRSQGKMAIVTGRPRKDCIKFLKLHGIEHLFQFYVCMGETSPKPSPDGVILASKVLGVSPTQCIMLGDTPDDVRAGKQAGARAYGVITPEEEAEVLLGISTVDSGMTSSLLNSGADGVLRAGLAQLLEIIPRPVDDHSTATSLLRVVPLTKGRIGKVERKTKETTITVEVGLDGTGISNISTGIGFLDHMFGQLSKHGRMDIFLHCEGDLHIDDHHTAEDCALALGEAFDIALGKREGIKRFGYAYCPLDEALSRVVVDISSRPHSVIDIQFTR